MLSGITCPEPGEGPGEICPLSSQQGSAYPSSFQTKLVSVRRASNADKDEKHMGKMDKEGTLCQMENDQI